MQALGGEMGQPISPRGQCQPKIIKKPAKVSPLYFAPTAREVTECGNQGVTTYKW